MTFNKTGDALAMSRRIMARRMMENHTHDGNAVCQVSYGGRTCGRVAPDVYVPPPRVAPLFHDRRK